MGRRHGFRIGPSGLPEIQRITRRVRNQAPRLIQAGAFSGPLMVGDVLAYNPSTESWSGLVTSVERRWLWDGVALGSGDVPWLLTPRDAWATPGLRLIATGPFGVTTETITLGSTVGQHSGVHPIAREGLSAGSGGALDHGDWPVPIAGGATYTVAMGMQRNAGGGLSTIGASYMSYGYVRQIAPRNKRHKFRIQGLSNSIRAEVGICVDGAWLGNLGSAKGYLIKLDRNWTAGGPIAVEIIKYNGASDAGTVLQSGGSISLAATEVEIDVQIGPTISVAITPDIGSAYSYVITDTAYRYPSIQIGDVLAGLATPKAVFTTEIGIEENEVIPEADRYALTLLDDFTDQNRGRINSVGTPMPGTLAWKDRFEWLDRINGESQDYGAGIFDLLPSSIRINAVRVSAPGQPQDWDSDSLTTCHSFAHQYGYREWRARFSKGSGSTGALWGMGRGDTWPGHEVDDVESDGGKPRKLSHALHLDDPDTGDDRNAGGFVTIPYGREIDQWNTIASEWKPSGEIDFRINSVCTMTLRHDIHQPSYLLANMALAPESPGAGYWLTSPNAGTPSPQSVEIDYVAIWQRPSHTAGLPVISSIPVISLSGGVLTMQYGVSNATSVRSVLRTGRKGGAKEVAGTEVLRGSGAAIPNGSIDWDDLESGKVNLSEEHVSASGAVVQVSSTWLWKEEEALLPWPSSEAMTSASTPIFSPVARPTYLQSVVDPRTASHATPTKVTRVSPSAGDGLWPGQGGPYDEAQYGNLNFGPVYSKQSPWSANGTYIACWDSGRASGQHLLNGSTKAHIRRMTGVSTQYRWFRSDDDKMAWLDWGSGGLMEPILRVYSVTSNASTVLKDFSGLGYNAASTLFGGEGNQSDDDRYWPMALRHTSGQWRIVVWDRVADSVVSTTPLDGQPGSASNVDWWGMSSSGEFLLTCTMGGSWNSGGTSVPKGLGVWSRAGTLLRTKFNGDGRSVQNHCDIGTDSDGFDVVTYIGPQNSGTSNDKFICTWRLDGSDGMDTRLQGPEISKTLWHVSCQAPGWAVIGSFPFLPAYPEYTSLALTSPAHNHIIAIKLDGSGDVYVIGNTRHTNQPIVHYYAQSAFACPNRQMTAVAAHSGWDYGDTSTPYESHMYIWERA